MKQKITRLSAVGLAALATLILPSIGVFAAVQTVNTTINGSIESVITITSGNTTAFSVTPAASAKMSTGSDLLTVNTNNVAGYNLTLSMTGAGNTLIKGVDSIAPATGTFASPAALGVNQWGYRADGAGTFGAGPTSVLNSVDATLTWAKVQPLATPDTIKSTTTTATNDTMTVWYAMNVDSSKPTGLYTNTVVYTASTK